MLVKIRTARVLLDNPAREVALTEKIVRQLPDLVWGEDHKNYKMVGTCVVGEEILVLVDHKGWLEQVPRRAVVNSGSWADGLDKLPRIVLL